MIVGGCIMSKVAKTTFGLMLATILAKFLGFGRELVLASSYGATMYSDAYLVAMNIPLVIFASIGGAIGTTFIPIYFDIESTKGEKKALGFTNNILNIIIIICILLSLLGFIFIEPIVKLFAFGFDNQTFLIAVNFTRILMLTIVFTGLSYVFTAYLQVKNDFIIPGMVSIPRNIIIICSIILSANKSPYIMVWGTLIGMVLDVLFLLIFAVKKGYKYKPNIKLNDEFIKKTLILVTPVFIGIAVNQVNAMVDRALASTLVEGSISALNYANKLNTFVMAMFISSISAVIYPILSKLSSEDNMDKFCDSIVNSINSVVLLVMPISVGAIVLSNPIVRVLFERGEFDARATNMTALALVMYSVGMVSFGLRDILNRVFYALHDTKTPMINGAIAMIMNIVLNIVLVRYLKLAGLALATSISGIVCIFLLFYNLKKKINYFGQDKIVITLIKSFVAALIMGIIVLITYQLMNDILGNEFVLEFISLFISIMAGIVVYSIMVIIFKVNEINIIIKFLTKKFKDKCNKVA